VTAAWLDGLASSLRSSPAWAAKADIAVVGEVFGPGDWTAGPGDDGAVVVAGAESLVVCGEAILPAFFERDPYGAGIAAVLTNVNDVAAMGALPLAVVDTLVGSRDGCRSALEGMRYASDLYGVPVVGGHLTISADRRALSAFALGRCPGPALSAGAVRPGDRLGLLVCLDGVMRDDFPFFPSFEERGRQLAGDVRLLAQLAGDGVCHAAKDVSMAGLVGSLAMLMEPTRTGVTIEVSDIPVPDGVALERWLTCFPCFSFLVCLSSDAEGRCADMAEDRQLTYARLGSVDDSGRIVLRDNGAASVVVDLGTEEITGLRPPA
jgi:uncharacterized protein